MEFRTFIHVASSFLHNAYLRSGDNLSFISSKAFTLPCIQGQLNRHHFGSRCVANYSHAMPTIDQLFNLRAVKKGENDTAVFEYNREIQFGSSFATAIVHKLLYDGKQLRSAQDVMNEIETGERKFLTILDLANVTISVEGIITLLCAYALAGVHNEHSNALLAVLCQASFPSRSVKQNTKLLSLTREKIDKVQPQKSGLATIFYENTTRKAEQLCKTNGGIEDILRHPISRTIVGMPSGLGMTSFDLLWKPGEKNCTQDRETQECE